MTDMITSSQPQPPRTAPKDVTLTVDTLAKAMPSNLRPLVTQELADKINAIAKDQEFASYFRENFLSYTKVLQDGKFKVEDYLNAVKYVSYKMLRHTNEEAYVKTFPERYQRLLANGASRKDISAYVSAYSKNKLVNLLFEQTQVPFHILNMDLRQEALMVQVDLMKTAASEKVRSDAANSVLSHLAPPKEAAPAVNFDMRESAGLKELTNALTKLAGAQITAIQNGTPVTEIAAHKIMDVQAKEVSDAD